MLPESRKSLDAIAPILNYVSRCWYEQEYGQVELVDRWYAPAMYFLERHYSEVAHDARR